MNLSGKPLNCLTARSSPEPVAFRRVPELPVELLPVLVPFQQVPELPVAFRLALEPLAPPLPVEEPEPVL